jgi:hypothetical protein
MKKVVLLINDGVSLRNFIYSNFLKVTKNFELEIWYDLPISLNIEGVKTYKIELATNTITDILKSSYINAKLKKLAMTLNEDIFYDYIFPDNKQGYKNKIKRFFKNVLSFVFKNKPEQILDLISFYEMHIISPKRSLNQKLAEANPDLIFLTSQRSSSYFSILNRAKLSKIKTATFIFSWDNPPKATLLYKTDYFFVWSDFMKNELIRYYKFTSQSKIIVTGTPQFEFHFTENKDSGISIDNYLTHNGDKAYVCFTGDDFTSSPQDDLYLNDFAIQVERFNQENKTNIKIIFRPCPVDFSSRYDWVLNSFHKLIIRISPKWEKVGKAWNSVIPKIEDNTVLSQILKNSILVTNLGSSIVFDAACHSIPCAYINYNPKPDNILKDVNRAYQYKHFDSMPTTKSVYWVNNPSDWYGIIKEIFNNYSQNSEKTNHAKKWFEIINLHPPQKASERIVKAIEEIIE